MSGGTEALAKAELRNAEYIALLRETFTVYGFDFPETDAHLNDLGKRTFAAIKEYEEQQTLK
ncbi:hypothetical protein D3C86_1092520 [compost metagenome]